MRLDQIVSLALEQLLGRLLRRAAAFALLGLVGLIAVYHFTVAGTLALEGEFGALYARLIIAGIYTAGGLIIFGFLYATRARPLVADAKIAAALPKQGKPRKMQLAMLVEAVMLGYALSARKTPR